MCGIVGIFNLDGKPVESGVIEKMAAAMAHRGPDGEDFYTDNNLALGHRRLSIIDPNPRSSQPMTSGNGRWTIVFNGCIYNYRSLRQDLISKGHTFRTESDTEVIVEGLDCYGIGFFKQLDGMFAVGAWDKETGTLHISRDRFGVKPLYYWLHNNTLCFASEIKAFMKHPDFKVELNYAALNEYFTFQNLFQYHTLFKGVYTLPAANTISIHEPTKKLEHNPWWDYDFTNPDHSISFEEAKDETKRLMEKAVSKQMVADVPVGSYLSGGMDSGSITAIASQHVQRLPTFTAGFDLSGVIGNESNYDERRDAEITANYYKTEHYEQIINSSDLHWSLPRVVWHLEDLRVGMSYPNYYISRLASKFVKVCLQGTGGDELFAGYPWRYYRVFNSLDKPAFFDQYYAFWQRLVNDTEKNELFTPEVFAKINADEPRHVFEKVFTFNENLKYDTPEHHIENSLYFEIKTFLPGLLLVGDKLSMANGLEERFPFLDNDLVDFAQKIPIKYKLGNLEHMKNINENTFHKRNMYYQEFDDGKNVLRKAMSEFLPEKIINRKKQGFSAPDENWYRDNNVAYIKDLLLSKQTVSTDYINRNYMEKIINEHVNGSHNHRLLIWSFMSFEWWCRLFLKNQGLV
ncbi:MAG: asparagine synthase (glutamine-hydrolyzing) [Flavobacteriales bacterium]|nr:asparagine synthase (glutamine-hydrolyzing) [Flavobacteriales bacterium]